METVRIDLSNGYATVFKAYKHKTSEAVQKLLRAAISPELLAKLQAEPDVEKRTALLKPLNIEGEDTVTLVNQVASLFYDGKEQLISPQSFGELSEIDYEKLLSEVNTLYRPSPLPPKP
jgi:hypothetical protein